MPHIARLLHAYHVAGRALDRGMRRAGGATEAEWQAEDDARIALGSARRAHVDAIRESISESTDYQQRTAAGRYLRPQSPTD